MTLIMDLAAKASPKYKLAVLRLLKGQTFSIDTETTGLRWYKNKLIGISIHCPKLGISEYLFTCKYEVKPYGKPKTKRVWEGDYHVIAGKHRKVKEMVALTPGKKKKTWTGEYLYKPTEKKVKKWVIRTEQATRIEAVPDSHLADYAYALLTEVASDPETCMIFHNYKFDAHFLGLDLIDAPCKIMDTSIMAHLYDSRLLKAMDKLEAYFLRGNSKRSQVEKAPAALKNKPWLWEPDVIYDYAKNDAVVTYQLMETLLPLLRKLKLIDLFRIQMRYVRTLWSIERRGIMLDVEFCKGAIIAFEKNLVAMEEELFDTVGYEFNWRSMPQLSKALYEDMGISKPVNPFADADGVDRSRMAHKGRYNKYCTSAFLLMEKADHPLGPLILDMREAEKLKAAVIGYIQLAEGTGVVHTNFWPTGTRTGRLSSREPNAQNIASAHRVRETQSAYSGGAIRQQEYNLRQAFKARPGYKFISVDHKQQEQKVFAILAQEPIMLQALKDRKDIHLMIAISVWGDCGPERNKLHREWSKTISFGLLYGMTTGSLRFRLNKTEEEAHQITEQYWTTFPRIQPFLKEVMDTVERYKRVRYWSGRIWRETEPDEYYKGCNAQIQGGAADLIQLAILRAQHILTYQGWGSVASIIHDEILCEVKDEYVELAKPVLARVMELEDIFGLPFAADLKVGDSYGTLEELKIEVDVSAIPWMDYVSPNFKLEQYSLVPWKAGRV